MRRSPRQDVLLLEKIITRGRVQIKKVWVLLRLLTQYAPFFEEILQVITPLKVGSQLGGRRLITVVRRRKRRTLLMPSWRADDKHA
jgi:hypothetical protein